VGSILAFRNLEQLENEASLRNKILRYGYGWNDEPYKAQWAIAQPAYRLKGVQYSLNGDQTRDKNRCTPLEQTKWRFTESDFAKIEALEARVQRMQDAVDELAEVSTKSSQTTKYLLEYIDQVELNRQYLVRRSVLEQFFFRPDGRPVQPLCRLLFHTSGKPRGIFRRLVLHKNGTPRAVFSHWMQNPASVSSHLG
jgi:hypothetical protein